MPLMEDYYTRKLLCTYVAVQLKTGVGGSNRLMMCSCYLSVWLQLHNCFRSKWWRICMVPVYGKFFYTLLFVTSKIASISHCQMNFEMTADNYKAYYFLLIWFMLDKRWGAKYIYKAAIINLNSLLLALQYTFIRHFSCVFMFIFVTFYSLLSLLLQKLNWLFWPWLRWMVVERVAKLVLMS